MGLGLLFWISGLSVTGSAQPTLGVVWDISEDNPVTNQQLLLFEELGVSHIEFPSTISEGQIQNLENYNFSILIRNDERYYTHHTLINQAESFRDLNREMINSFDGYDHVVGFGIISESHFKDPKFSSALEEISAPLLSQTDKTLYYYQNRQWFPLGSSQQSFGEHLNRDVYHKEDLYAFDQQFKDYVQDGSNLILFVNTNWLTEAVEVTPELGPSIKLYHEEGRWSFPMPHIDRNPTKANWLVFALLVLWIVLAVQVKFIPNARPMILRYFFAHRFYVDDILYYRERYATQSIIMMIIHALSCGIVTYVSTSVLLSTEGMNALSHHFPWLDLFNNGYVSLSVLMIITILIFQAVSIFWLYLPAKNLRSMSQTANLYAGLLYTDYLTLTLLISFYVTGFSAIPVTILATFYFLIWFINFYLTAFNISRNQTSEKLLYFILTSGLHTVINLSLVLYLIIQTDIIDILRLSFSL